MPKKIKEWETRVVQLAGVHPAGYNPRTIKKRNLKGLYEALERFGYVDMIVWNERTGNIVGGHQRYKVLVEQGVREATMVVVDMSEQEEKAANLSLNNPAIEGQWDSPIDELLESVETEDPELFSNANFDKLRDAVTQMAPGDDGEDETDTECPCCGHRWEISDEDVVVLNGEQQRAMARGDDNDAG